jgi:putative nucleotidyltransferase with HDIG domain
MDAYSNVTTAEECVEAAWQMRPLPAIALEIARLAENADSTAQDFQHIIEGDPILTARIVTAARANYFSEASSQVRDVHHAIVSMGLTATRNLTLGLCVHSAFSPDTADAEVDQEEFWNHSLAVAAGARIIAQSIGEPRDEPAFLMGLIHDIGKAIMSDVTPERFARVVLAAARTGKDLWEAERAILGFGHAEVGGLAAARWHIAAPIPAAIAAHHQPSSGVDPDPLYYVVKAADVLAYASGHGFSGVTRAPELSAEVAAALGLSSAKIDAMCDALESHLARARPMFGIPAQAPRAA